MVKETEEHDLISTVFSSVVKTSIKQCHKASTAKNKKSLLQTAPSPFKSSIAKSSPGDAKEAAANNEWIVVSHKSKAVNAIPNVQLVKPTGKQKKIALESNSFFLPTKLESCLHNPTQNSKTITAPAIDPSGTPTRCFKRNQRRARRRAQKRKELETAEKHKTAHCPTKIAAPISAPVIAGIKDMSFGKEGDTKASSPTKEEVDKQECGLLCLPYEVLTGGVMSFLRLEDMASFGECSMYSKQITEEGYLWESMFKKKFPLSQLSSMSMKEWKLAYQLTLSQIVDRLRCYHTKTTFFEDVLGVGVDYTVNPKTKAVDYISLSQDLLSETAFKQHKVRMDVFGNTFKLFLPLFFSEEHFRRALPQIRKTLVRLCPQRQASRFDPIMVLDVIPKIITTFVVLLSDEGIAASQKSFNGLTRIHRLFLQLAHEYPIIKQEAAVRLKRFLASENSRIKSACPNLGGILPLLMVVDQKDFQWADIRSSYLCESFDRSVLWVCKNFPRLEKTHNSCGTVESEEAAEERVTLSCEAMTVNLRLLMFNVYFLYASCQGTTQERANRYDRFFGQLELEDGPDDKVDKANGVDEVDAKSKNSSNLANGHAPLSFSSFRDNVNVILSSTTWNQFFRFVGVRCPQNKAAMASILRQHVKNSRRKGYHKAGMDFSRIQASGTSKILAKGQNYSAATELKRVVFSDVWKFEGNTKYLDATCIMYQGKKRVCTVDYSHTEGDNGAVQHSGDMMTEDGGTHRIHLDLLALDPKITSCVFVISAFADATLSDILSTSISFSDADADPDSTDPLCTYDLDSHDKISHLTSVVMCKLYRTRNGGWHVLAIGDAHRGAARNYDPIYAAVKKLL